MRGKDEYNSFVHKNLKEFVEKFLSFDEKGNRLVGNNRCRCPLHESKDSDLAYNGRYGYWKCFGKCNETISDSFSLVQKIYFPVQEGSSKEEWKKSFKKTCEMFEQWIDGREIDNIIFQTESQQHVSEDVKLPSIFKMLSEKFISKNPIFTPEYVRFNIRKWFKLAEIDRFNKKTLKEFRIYETTDELPKEMYFLSNFYYYMLYDDNNRLVGFQGRRKDDSVTEINGFNIPKMYNLSGFDKSKMIYNLYNCKNCDSIVITEGPGDAVNLYELFGEHMFVSLMGGEISPYQIYLLKKYFAKNTRITLFLDNDAPGKHYAKKIAKKLLKEGFTKIYISHVWSVKDTGALKGLQGQREFAFCFVNAEPVGLDENDNLIYGYHLDLKGKSRFQYLLDKQRKIKKTIFEKILCTTNENKKEGK